MSADDSQLETASPGDLREEELSRRQKEVFHTIKGFVLLFVALQAYPVIVALLGWTLTAPGLLLVAFALPSIPIAGVSVLVAVIVLAIAWRNAAVLEWWMIAVGVLPWMVIATEVTVTFVFAWL